VVVGVAEAPSAPTGAWFDVVTHRRSGKMQFQQMPQQRGGMPMQQSYNGQTQYRMPAGGMQQGQQMRSMPQGMQQSQGFVQGGRQVQSMGGAMPQQQMMQRGGVMPQQSVPQHQHHQVKVVGASPDDGGTLPTKNQAESSVSIRRVRSVLCRRQWCGHGVLRIYMLVLCVGGVVLWGFSFMEKSPGWVQTFDVAICKNSRPVCGVCRVAPLLGG